MPDQVSAPAAPAPEAPAATEQPAESTQAEGEGQPAEPKAEPKKKAPAYKKYKVGDQELNLTDDDVVRHISKGLGADKQFREAAEARKATEAFMQKLIEDPEAVLSDPRLSIDRKRLAEKWLVQKLEEELNPPDPRDEKLTAAEKELKEYKDKERQAAEAKDNEERTAAVEQRRTAIGNVLREAGKLTPLSGSPESEAALIREMAMYMRAAKERGEEPTAQEVAEHIHNQRFQQFYTLANQFEGEDLIDFLGEAVVSKLRKADLARLRKSREPEATHRTEPGERRDSSKPVKKMDGFAARDLVKKWAQS